MQAMDYIVIKEDTLLLFSNPLEQLPNWGMVCDSILVELEREDERLNPEKYNPDQEVESLFDCIGRGLFYTRWRIEDDKLYLIDIRACLYDVHVDLITVFPNISDSVLFAEWFTGELVIPVGKIIERNPCFLEQSICEKKLFIKVKNGEVKRIRERRNR